MSEKSYEQEVYEEELRENRKKEQLSKKDYSYLEGGEIEKCDDCGCPINSHDHCPNCDY